MNNGVAARALEFTILTAPSASFRQSFIRTGIAVTQ